VEDQDQEEDLEDQELVVLEVTLEMVEDPELEEAEEGQELVALEEQMVAQELEDQVVALDLEATQNCQATVGLEVETAWEDLVLEILTMMPGEEKK